MNRFKLKSNQRKLSEKRDLQKAKRQEVIEKGFK